MEASSHVVFMPYPAPGHGGPYVHFAKHLSRCGVAVSFIAPDSELSKFKSVFKDASLVTVVPFVFSIHQDKMEIAFFFRIRDWMQSHGDMFHDIIAHLDHGDAGPPVCIISDMFLGFTQEIADKLGILRYCLYSSPAHWLSFTFHMPQFYGEGRLPATGWEVPPFVIPNFPPIRACDLPPSQHLASEKPNTFFVDEAKPLWRAAGVIVNTVEEVEAPVIEGLRKFLKQNSPGQAPTIWTLGPVLGELWEGDSKSTFRERMCAKRPRAACFDWLDQQPEASVVYVCYGSIAIPSVSQVQEIAVALENSGQRFFWVLRTAEKEKVLPEGFLERTKSRGIVYTEWAPQLHILAHSAVGGFVSHCGWNSATESLCMGVPIIAMPVQGDQLTNATLISSVLGVGTRINDIGTWFQNVDNQSIETGIRSVMSNVEMRSKAERISAMLQRAVRPGGSSHSNLLELVQHLKSLRSSSSSPISKPIA